MKYTFEHVTAVYKGRNQILPFSCALKRTDKIALNCPVHGNFNQAISSVLKSVGCRQCYFDSMKGDIKDSTKSWIKKATLKHNNVYGYENAVFAGCANKVSITCYTHGSFNQNANVHLAGHGCPKCATDRTTSAKGFDTTRFIEAALLKHSNLYSYAKSVFTGIRDTLIITCPTHGDFSQVAYYHTFGHGCPKCGIEKTTYKSAPEYEIIEYIKSLNVNNIRHSDRHLGFELDIFIPDYKIAIEYNGLYWHSSNNTVTDAKLSKYHLKKTQACESNGIKLFHIFENEWLDPHKKEVWKSVIKNALGLSNRVYARKCVIREIANTESNEFCSNNHLQGVANSSSWSYGMFLEDTLVSVVTLGTCRYSKVESLEVLRFCNKLGHSVIGGFSKFIKYIIQHHNKNIISYANRRWSTGNLYKQTGFTLDHVSGPCYFYLDSKMKMYHRSSFTKKAVLKKFPNSVGTEVSIMYENGYSRIWDCGNMIYVRNIK